MKNNEEKDFFFIRILFVYHLFIAFIYFLFTDNGGGDAWGYWYNGSKMIPDDFFSFLFAERGTSFMLSFNYLFSGLLKMGYLANTFVYALLGFIGLVLFYKIALEIIPYNSKFLGIKLFPLLFFLPNLHFWSSGVGKDSLLFLCVALFAYGMMNIGKRIPLLIISVILSLAVRPHILLFLLASFGLMYIFNRKAAGWVRVVISFGLIVGFIVALPLVLEYTKIEELTIDNLNQFNESRAEGLSRSHTGSSIVISSYPYPLKVFTFLYRPLFFDYSGIMSLLASFENLLLLVLSLVVIFSKPIETFRKAPFVVKSLFIFLVVGALAFSPMLGNLGIMLRMRNMFLPGMLLYIMWSFSYNQEQKARDILAAMKLLALRKKILIEKNKSRGE